MASAGWDTGKKAWKFKPEFKTFSYFAERARQCEDLPLEREIRGKVSLYTVAFDTYNTLSDNPYGRTQTTSGEYPVVDTERNYGLLLRLPVALHLQLRES